MIGYSILGVHPPGDPNDPMYPEMNEEFAPVFGPEDGTSVRPIELRGIFVVGNVQGQTKTLTGSKDLHGTMWVTDQRVIILCKNYDQVKWDGSNNRGVVIFGLGVETTWHLASKAYHRVTSIGKAMTAHLYYPWIGSVGWQPDRDRKHRARIRLGITVRLDNGGSYERGLEVGFEEAIDASAFAQALAQRVGKWRLSHGPRLDEKHRVSFETLAKAAPLDPPTPGSVRLYRVPQFSVATEETTPGAIATRTANSRSEAKASTPPLANQKVSRVVDGSIPQETFLTYATEYHPPFELIAEPTERPDLGLVVTGEPGLQLNRGDALWHARVNCQGTFRVDDDGLPSEAGSFEPLYKGWAELLITDTWLIVLLTSGWTAGGFAGSKHGRSVLVSYPIDLIYGIGVKTKNAAGAETSPMLGFVSHDKSWGMVDVSEIAGVKAPASEQWTMAPVGQSAAAVEIAMAICASRGLPRPERRTEPLGHSYLVASSYAGSSSN